MNDMDENVGGPVNKFTNDMKVGGVMESEEGFSRVSSCWKYGQEIAERVYLDKCEVSHFG